MKPCPHCQRKARPVSCVRCNRDMCEHCISIADIGYVCGLCKDELAEESETDQEPEVITVEPWEWTGKWCERRTRDEDADSERSRWGGRQ